jgi:predicted MPP superfamily phosphohydrolase
MPTAELRTGFSSEVAEPPFVRHDKRRRPILPLRPFHKMWRRQIDKIEVTRVSLPVRRLPAALAGLVACQISDFHVDRDEDLDRLEAAVDLINRQEPELVFLTGDYFSDGKAMRRYLRPFTRALRELRPSIGVFAIAGNHDHWASFDRIEEGLAAAGAVVLSNESRRLALRGKTLTIVGIDDLWTRRSDPARAFSAVAPGDCTLVLAHNPDTALYARHLRPGAMVAGHTHGGVLKLPLYGTPFKSVLRLGKEFCSGLNLYDDFYIYTNRGLGTFWVRVRFNCRPEVSRFELVPHHAPAAVETRPAKRRRRLTIRKKR